MTETPYCRDEMPGSFRYWKNSEEINAGPCVLIFGHSGPHRTAPRDHA